MKMNKCLSDRSVTITLHCICYLKDMKSQEGHKKTSLNCWWEFNPTSLTTLPR
uniref:Uncharacterized protein n=1 Tax=Rhizophora mucronata TaxID=61149 RepID=A0A2P2QXX3_RHIMU